MLSSTASSILVPLLGLIVAAIVIRLSSQEVWGGFVQVLILVQFAVHLIAWGNREYLLRAFSRKPANAVRLWQDSLATRLIIFLLLLPGTLLIPASVEFRILLIVWALGLVIFDAVQVLVVYHKDFIRLALVEAAAFFVTILYLVIRRDAITMQNLVCLFALVTGLKAAYFTAYYRAFNWPADRWRTARIDFRYFRLALPFFILGFSGMLNSRVDLYAVGVLLPPAELARYQVSINMFLYLQAIAAAIVAPFIKNLYRLELASVRRFSRSMLLIGVAITAVGTPLIVLLLRYGYGMNFPFSYFAVGFAFVIPIYYTLPTIYTLYRLNGQKVVLVVNIVGIGLNLAITLMLVPLLGLIGALLSTTIVRWIALVVYHGRRKIMVSADEFVLEGQRS